METRTLKNRDGFGFVDRSDEDAACAGGNPYCQLIDDAAVYYKIVPKDIFDRVYDDSVTDRVNYPNFPPGRINALYRVFIIVKKFKAYGNRPPKVGEIIKVLDIVESEVRGLTRQDDYQLTDILIRWMLGLKLGPNEKIITDRLVGEKSKPASQRRPPDKKKSNLPIILASAAGVVALVGVIAIARRRR